MYIIMIKINTSPPTPLPSLPQLKSVANLPWRVFVYRACNTFIDDLFAFIIRMPTLHRLSAFRDDVVFLVYLFQRFARGGQ